MPANRWAAVSERIQMGLTIRVCTSAPDFVGALRRAIYGTGGWNDVLDGSVPRSEAAPAGAFVFGGASEADDCGEDGSTHEVKTDNTGFEAVFMDYRDDCAAFTADVPATDCGDTSCLSDTLTAVTERNCSKLPSLSDRPSGMHHCTELLTTGCVRLRIRGGFRPFRSLPSIARMVRYLDDGVFLHELGHYLTLPDYDNGCYWISGNTADGSLMSSGGDPDDWRDWARVVHTQNEEADDCRSGTITEIDRRNLHTLYHPAAFQSLSSVEKPIGSNIMRHLLVGAPPRDLNGNSFYNAYRYVVLHRAPQGTRATPNAFTQLMIEGEPVVFTVANLTDTDELKDDDDIGVLDANGRFMVKMVNLDDPAFSGHEFVFVGVTRGDPLRDPSKPLNPVLASGLEHAVMGLNLDLEAFTGLSGVRNWTLGTPVSYTNS